MLDEGWRDMWSEVRQNSFAGVESWTWQRCGNQARYDRLYFRSMDGYTARCLQAEVLRDVWGEWTDHAALHVLLEWSTGMLADAAIATAERSSSSTGALVPAVLP